MSKQWPSKNNAKGKKRIKKLTERLDQLKAELQNEASIAQDLQKALARASANQQAIVGQAKEAIYAAAIDLVPEDQLENVEFDGEHFVLREQSE